MKLHIKSLLWQRSITVTKVMRSDHIHLLSAVSPGPASWSQHNVYHQLNHLLTNDHTWGRPTANCWLCSPREVILFHHGGVCHHALQRLFWAGITGVPPEVVGRVVLFLIPGQEGNMKGYGWSLHLEHPPKTTQRILALAQHYGAWWNLQTHAWRRSRHAQSSSLAL